MTDEVLVVRGLLDVAYIGSVAVSVDELDPLTIQILPDSLGRGYLEIGAGDRQLLEVAVELPMQAIASLVVKLVDKLTPWPSIRIVGSQAGVPLLGTQFEEYGVLKLEMQYKVAVSGDQAIVYWGDVDVCRTLDAGVVAFLVHADRWVGVLVRGLGMEVMGRLRAHFG